MYFFTKTSTLVFLILFIGLINCETVSVDAKGSQLSAAPTCSRTTCSEATVRNFAPNFKAKAVMPNGEFQEVQLSDFKGKYVVLMFYPLDFT